MLERQNWSKEKVKNRTSNEYNVLRWGDGSKQGSFSGSTPY